MVYTYIDLIDILNGMYNEEEILKGDSINWGRLQLEATNSIIEKLYHLQNDSQRTGFLSATFLRIFNDGKDYNLQLVEDGVSDNSDGRTSEQYVYNCLLVLNGLVNDVSEACLQYEGIDFPEIIKQSINTGGVKLNFVIYSRKQVDNFRRMNLGQLLNKSEAVSSISKNYDLDYYFNVKNVIQQDFVHETLEYFENGEGKHLFEPLIFLNLFWMQLEYFEENISKPFSTISALLALPLTDQERYILIGFILNFYGGSPIQVINVQHSVTLILLERTYARLNKDISNMQFGRSIQDEDYKTFIYTVDEFLGITERNDLDFYFNIKNQPNTALIFETFDHFETGERRNFIEPVVFFNLLWKQYQFVVSNIDKAYSVITSLKNLQINEELRHVLLGFILKWFGGYPMENLNPQYQSTLKLIEKEFLKYDQDTPEKEYCKKYSLRKNEVDWNTDNGIEEPPLPLEQIVLEANIELKLNSFINNFNSLNDYEFIKNHFHQLTALKSKNGNPHLTEEQLTDFLRAAFQHKIVENRIKINFQKGEKHTIRKVFYSFYKLCELEYESTRNVKEKYVRLLSDYFIGFDYDSVFNNFNK